ncbi:MAG: PepSY-associated TM helix domain-containing protein [Corticimicrobacter sp.]|uniref:PepSY-associated TM helix domain-containing protein n=1 Tax=Corticimicrobacter sp. TaxID=2678536 RepID=UPI0032DB87E9
MGRWLAALCGGGIIGVAVAVAVALLYPDMRGTNRLYAGIFLGVLAWGLTVCGCVLPRLRKQLFAIHGWVGLVCGGMLFVLCFSGTLALLKDILSYREARSAQGPLVQVREVDRVLAHAQAMGWLTLDGNTPYSIVLPTTLTRYVAVREASAHRDKPDDEVWLDSSGLRRLEPDRGVLARLPTELHRHLLLEFPGRILVSLFGFALLALVVGGIVLHPRHGRMLWRIRWRQGLRVLLGDLHRWLGLWLLPMWLLIALTGVLSGLGALGTVTLARFVHEGGVRQTMQELMPAPPSAIREGDSLLAPGSAVRGGLDAVLRRHERDYPGSRPQLLDVRPETGGDAVVTVAGVRAGLLSTAVFERDHYRLSDALPLRHDSVSGRGFWLQAFAAIQPLHFARYGGGAVTLLYALAGLSASVLVASGLFLWLRRRQAQGADVLRFQAWLVGSCGGLVTGWSTLLLASSLPAAISIGPQMQTWVFWSCWICWLLLALLRPGWCAYYGLYRQSVWTGSCLVLAGWSDMAWLWGRPWTSSMPSWCVDLVLLVLGAWLVWLGVLRTRSTVAQPRGICI